jgi:hypothetical protein
MESAVTWLFLAFLVLAAIVAAAALAGTRRGSANLSADESWPFYARKLLSQPEQVLYHRLVNALPECFVLAQVQLSRLLDVKKGVNAAGWKNRISQKSVDFVVCRKDSTVVAVVELDDSTHNRVSRQRADATKDKALISAGVSIVRWNVKSLPEEAEIRARFAT